MIFTVFDVLERLSLLMVGHLMHNCKPYVLCQESIFPLHAHLTKMCSSVAKCSF